MVPSGVTRTKKCMKFLASAYSTFCTGNNTRTFFFSPVFHFFQQACAMILLITQHSKLQYPDTNSISFTFSGSLSLAALHRPVQDRFKLRLILLCSNWKILINFSCRMKPWLLTFFALPSSMNRARNGQAFLSIPSARAHPSRTCQMFSPYFASIRRSTSWMEFNKTLKNCFSPSSQSKQPWDLDWNSASTTYTGALKLHKADMFCFVWGRLMRLTKQKLYGYLLKGIPSVYLMVYSLFI